MRIKIKNISPILCLILVFEVGLAYDRYQASRYADKWAAEGSLKRNPNFHDYPCLDCANYASQCLIAGGISLMDGPGVDNWHAIPDCGNLNTNLDFYQYATISSIIYPAGSPPGGLEWGDVNIYGDETGDYYKHAVIVAGGAGNSAYCNAHCAERYHRNWNFWWGTDSGQFKRASFYELPDDAGGQANLKDYTPPGWDGPLIISKISGTNFNDYYLEVGKPVYIDWAVTNEGDENVDIPDTIYYALYIDDTLIQRWYTLGLWYYWYASVEDYEYTVNEPGFHYVKILADQKFYWQESDEFDNYFGDWYYWYGTSIEEPKDQSLIFRLYQNTPNPFYNITVINYYISKESEISLSIYTEDGRLAKQLIRTQIVPAGQHQVKWDGRTTEGRRCSSGVYFYVLECEGFKIVKKLIYMR